MVAVGVLGAVGTVVPTPVAGAATAAGQSTSPSPFIVTVVDGVEPLAVAGSVGATATFRYDTAMNRGAHRHN